MNIPDDPFIVELLPEFIDTWINDIDEQFDGLIANQDSDSMYRFGHTLKGSCFQFGLDEIANLGIELMGHAKEQDWDKASELKSQIKDIFVSVKKTIETK